MLLRHAHFEKEPNENKDVLRYLPFPFPHVCENLPNLDPYLFSVILSYHHQRSYA